MPRRTGNSTRIIDRCVQELFTKEVTYVYDTSRKMGDTKTLFHKFRNRLDLEHPNTPIEIIEDRFSGIQCYKVVLLPF